MKSGVENEWKGEGNNKRFAFYSPINWTVSSGHRWIEKFYRCKSSTSSLNWMEVNRLAQVIRIIELFVYIYGNKLASNWLFHATCLYWNGFKRQFEHNWWIHQIKWNALSIYVFILCREHLNGHIRIPPNANSNKNTKEKKNSFYKLIE